MKVKPAPKLTQFNQLSEFLDLIDREDPSGCWIWRGDLRHGRGPLFRLKLPKPSKEKRYRSARRIAYLLFKGEQPPSNTTIHTTCRNVLCVNPDHMRFGPPAREACARGHPYTEESVYVTSQGKRACRICIKENTRIYREKFPDRVKASKDKWRLANKEKERDRMRERRRQKGEGA